MAVKDATPDIRPRAGHDLLTGIEHVLPRLVGPVPADLADDLMTALVRCTACGDISRVREQADAVRRAAALLRTGTPEQAGPILTQARADLLTFAPLA